MERGRRYEPNRDVVLHPRCRSSGAARRTPGRRAAMLRCIVMAALALAALPASAQTFPNRPVHVIVAYAPGGTGDVVARIVADKLGPALGQSVVVENRAG